MARGTRRDFSSDMVGISAWLIRDLLGLAACVDSVLMSQVYILFAPSATYALYRPCVPGPVDLKRKAHTMAGPVTRRRAEFGEVFVDVVGAGCCLST